MTGTSVDFAERLLLPMLRTLSTLIHLQGIRRACLAPTCISKHAECHVLVEVFSAFNTKPGSRHPLRLAHSFILTFP